MMKNRRQGQSQVLTKDEIKRVVQFQRNSRHSTRNLCLVNMSLFTGMRVGEVSQLKLKDVVNENWELKKEVVLRKEYTKTKKNRVIYLVHPEVRKSLEEYIGERRKMETVKEPRKPLEKPSASPNPVIVKMEQEVLKKKQKFSRQPLEKPLFISQKNSAFSPRSLQRLYKQMMKSVGLDEMCSSHSFRRTFITNLITQGIDIKTVSTLAGHSSVQTTVDVYAVANPNKMENVCRNISIF
jgi:integrase/recombinase XerD